MGSLAWLPASLFLPAISLTTVHAQNSIATQAFRLLSNCSSLHDLDEIAATQTLRPHATAPTLINTDERTLRETPPARRQTLLQRQLGMNNAGESL